MGGKAFSETLSTPRMPPAIYIHVREQTRSTIRKYYRYAESPIEAPGKNDYGDVDILVAEPLKDVKPETIAAELVAKEVKKVKGSSTTHFALPWPKVADDADAEIHIGKLPSTEANLTDQKSPLIPGKSRLHLEANVTEACLTTFEKEGIHPTGDKENIDKINIDQPMVVIADSKAIESTVLFIQLDLHICLDHQRMQWELFHNAHGDLWNIIGGIIRRFGLTVTNSGFYLRIEELKSYNKDLERVKLTEDPSEVLKFLGLDVQRFWLPFKTMDQMMAYGASCRFHDPSRGADKDKNRAELKSNDRQRARKRPTFAIWVDDYLPAHRQDPAGEAAGMTRMEVIEEVKRVFGKEFAEDFERKKAERIRNMGIERLWSGIRKDLPIEGIEIGYVVKGIKREVAGDAEDAAELTEVQQAYRDGDFAKVASWAAENWREAGERQKAFDRIKSRNNLGDKLERDRLKEEQAEKTE